jgi:hypothetical protein
MRHVCGASALCCGSCEQRKENSLRARFFAPPPACRGRLEGGCSPPSMGFTPTRCALRGQPAAVRIRSRRIRRLRRQDAEANIGVADGPKGEAQDVPSNPEGPRPSLSASKTKRPTRGRFVLLAEREGFEPSVVLPLRLISSQVHSTTLPPLQRGARGPREPASLRGRRNGDKHTERRACLQGDGLSRLFSSPAAARCRPRYRGSATAIRSPVPSAIRPDPDGHWDLGRKCRCICPWHERS